MTPKSHSRNYATEGRIWVQLVYILYKRQNIFVLTYLVLYAFLNRPFDCDGIWYKDRLDLEEEDKLHFVANNVNTKSKPGRFSNKDFEIIIIILFFFIYKWLKLILIIIKIIIINAKILCICILVQ